MGAVCEVVHRVSEADVTETEKEVRLVSQGEEGLVADCWMLLLRASNMGVNLGSFLVNWGGGNGSIGSKRLVWARSTQKDRITQKKTVVQCIVLHGL